jgi:zona occludens toxin
MPINAFGGGVGTGKTYGVMEHVVLPAVAAGRFIITNIEGLNEQAIYDYVAKHFYKGKIICIGHIRRCDRNAPEEEDFFPGQDALDKAVPVPAPDAPKVIGGDLVIVDEATRYWPQDEKVKKSHAYFFREHRHFANEIGHTCDLVVIDPDLSMLARALKGKVEMSSITHKPKEIGLNKYVVNLYRGVTLRAKPVSTQGPFSFKKEVYSLYKSYANEKAKEQAIDKRQNLLKNPRLWFYVGGMVLLLALCMWGLYSYYRHQVDKFAPKEEKGNPATAAAPGVPASAAPASAATSSGKSDLLRVAGEVVLHGERWVLLANQDGTVRFENPAAFVGRGPTMVGNVEGQRVATWTGAAPKQQTIIGGGK